MLVRAADPHEVLDEIFSQFLVDGQAPAMVKSRWPAISSPFYPLRILIVMARSIAMTADLARAVLSAQSVVVREFWNVPLLLMTPLFYCWRKRILWNVNHNLRGGRGRCPVSLSLAARLGFRFLLFDGSVAVARFPGHVRRAFSTPLFPMTDRAPARRARREAVCVSLVGDMRPEKVASGELDLVVRNLCGIPGVRVQVGARTGTLTHIQLPPEVALADTSSRSRYLDLLADSDVVVILARRDAYFYRHSGTVIDAISCGAWPVVPAFPVLEVQVGQPDQVGSTYGSTADIVTAVNEAMTLLESAAQRRSRYFSGRGRVNLKTMSAQDGLNHD